MPVRRSYKWVWFFLILAVLGVAAAVIQIRYNLAQQLRPEQLADARSRWRQVGPRDYRLQFTQTGSTAGTFVVWVRNGEVRAAIMKQYPDQPDAEGRRLEPYQYPYYSMEGLFGIIDDFLRMEARTFMVAHFDPHDGHLTRFVRRVSGTRERQEITEVRLEPAAPGDPLPPFLSRGR